MNHAEWDELLFETREQMVPYVRPYVTPISRTDDPNYRYGWASGTGNYVQLRDGRPYVLTNEHVAAEAQTQVLSHLPSPGSFYERFTSDFIVWPWPYDVALSAVAAGGLPQSRGLITGSQFDSFYQPVDGELLFWLGYPGTTGARFDEPREGNTRYSWAGELATPGVPMLTQAFRGKPEVDPRGYSIDMHVLVHYPQAARRMPNEAAVGLPSPHGLSGSLLWDTKRVACAQRGQPWTPAVARVCGLIFATWPDPAWSSQPGSNTFLSA